MTADRRCSFAELCPSLFGQANVFVSHAWKCRFGDLLAQTLFFDHFLTII